MSSSTDETGRERRDRTSPEARAINGTIRRWKLGLTSGVQWKIIGYSLLEGGQEVRPADVFSNVGFFSRPKASVNAEAIGVFVGGASNPVIIATRDEDTRKLIAQLDPDQTAIFNSATIILIKGNTVEVRLAGGVATKLPTLADYEALRAFVNAQFSGAGHTHAVTGGSTTSTLPIGSPPGTPAGTQVLKAQ